MTIKVIVLLLLTSLYGIHSLSINGARLFSGRSGIVQLLTSGGWQNLCSSSWRIFYNPYESHVLCRHLGYNTSERTSYGYQGCSSLNAIIRCSGNESKLSECYYNFKSLSEPLESYESCCNDLRSVTCSPCTNGSVQLRGGVIPETGAVEYCVSGTWVAVSGHLWNDRHAFVVCRQLGLPATDAIAFNFLDHSPRYGNILRCFGNESSLSSCQVVTNTPFYRTRVSAAGVYCKGDVITDLCVNGHIRLAGGKDANEGRVEVCSNGVWGTIFSNYFYWDDRDAQVACRQLGFPPSSRVEVYRFGHFGPGTGPILYHSLHCNGDESTLDECDFLNGMSLTRWLNSYDHDSVRHSSDAGVRCSGIISSSMPTSSRSDCSDGDVHLVNGTMPGEGRVEICYNRVWGSVCDSRWDEEDAAIVCLQLNFQGTNATALRGSYFGSGTGPYHLRNVNCRGDERTLFECQYHVSSPWRVCGPDQDAGVRCDTSTCSHGEVRLFGGYTDLEGVAEVCINGFWADICDNSVSTQTVRSFCRQFTGSVTSIVYTSMPRQGSNNQHYVKKINTGNITLYGIRCSTDSRSIAHNCAYSIVSGYSAGGCNLQRELIIGCYERTSCTNGDIRLRDGSSTYEGRVEICIQGEWGAIAVQKWSSSEYLGFREARVVCRQLGYPWEWAIGLNIFTRNNTRNIIRQVRCSGSERRLIDCSYSSIRDLRNEQYDYTSAGVICQGNTAALPQCERGDVRLVGGRKKSEGRLEICVHSYWATVCSRNQWGNPFTLTMLVCKKLGFSNGQLGHYSPFGPNYALPIVIISCSAENTNISQCTPNITNTRRCTHGTEIGIYCREEQQTKYYSVKIDKHPDKQSYEIGSQVKLTCSTVNDQDQDVADYRWYSGLKDHRDFGRSVFNNGRTLTAKITAEALNSLDFYCQVFSHSGSVIGTQRMTLQVKDLLQSNKSTTNNKLILQVEPVKAKVLDYLLGLTWYHNGSVITTNYSQRHNITNRGKILTITNFTSEAGVYKAQFNQILVPSIDENCREEVLSLLRHLPVLKPAVFCVNMEGDCPKDEQILRTVSIKVVHLEQRGTLNGLILKAEGNVLCHNELKHSYFEWYMNGSPIGKTSIIRSYRIIQVKSSLSALERNDAELKISQELKLFNVTNEYSGRYEVFLYIEMSTFVGRDPICHPYYDFFLKSSYSYHDLYYYREVIDSYAINLARGYVGINYYRDLTFNVTVCSTTNESATLTCRANITFPPFSSISLIKNGVRVANSACGQVQLDLDIITINADSFGLYICQINASGVIFNKRVTLKDRVIVTISIETENLDLCLKSIIEDALVSKISSECQCSFDHVDLHNSSIVYEGNELVYTATLEYSSEDGSETASVIAGRIASQVPFAMAANRTLVTVTNMTNFVISPVVTMDYSSHNGLETNSVSQTPFSVSVGGVLDTVTSACSDDESYDSQVNAEHASFSPFVGSGLFLGGFLTAVVVIGITTTIILCSKGIEQSESRTASQLDSGNCSKGDLFRNPSYVVNSKMKVKAQDYEEVQYTDHPIYEAVV